MKTCRTEITSFQALKLMQHIFNSQAKCEEL